MYLVLEDDVGPTLIVSKSEFDIFFQVQVRTLNKQCTFSIFSVTLLSGIDHKQTLAKGSKVMAV